jgi:ornithine carbamoyltransferase
MRHLLEIDDLSQAELDEILALARAVKADRSLLADALLGVAVAIIFEKPSTRTRVSFEVGISEMSGIPIVLRPGEMQLGRGETIHDTARVLSRYVGAIVARVDRHAALEEMARFASVPVVNALSDKAHPCQALADLLTLEENGATSVGYVGDGNNVATSLLLGCARRGISITLACPGGFAPDPEIVARAGDLVRVVDRPEEATKGVDAVYTDVWVSMGDEAEAEARRRAFEGFTVSPPLVPDGAIFLHDLPAHRGEEVAAEVIDGPASRVWDQAENRLHVQKALLAKLLGRAP